jgi:copper(I)-binding protein
MTTTLSAVNVRRRLASVVLVLAVPALSSCAVSFGAQTDQVYNPSTGVDDRSGAVDVLNALVVSGTTGSGAVIATLVNNDQQRPDELRGVAGSGSDASLKVTPGGATTIPAGGLLNLATDGRIAIRGARVAPGNFVTITFTFARAQAITVQAPVVANSSEYAGVKVPTGP